MPSNNIRYSVLIPTRARPELVRCAVLSALAPRHNSEVIIVEDRTQDAVGLPTQLTSQTGRVRYLRNESGLRGASATRNFGANAARGKFIVFLDDDDEFVPGYLDMLNKLFLHPPARWGFADQVKVASSGVEYRAKSAILRSNHFRRKIAAMSAGFWIESTLYQAAGGLDSDQTIDEDTDLCCRLIGQGYNPHYCPMDAIRLNRDPDVARLTSSTDQRQIAACYLRTYAKNIECCRNDPGAEAYLLLRAHQMMCRAGNFAGARELGKGAERFHVRQMARMQGMKYQLESRFGV